MSFVLRSRGVGRLQRTHAARMRRADEGEWKPLLTGIEGDGERE